MFTDADHVVGDDGVCAAVVAGAVSFEAVSESGWALTVH